MADLMFAVRTGELDRVKRLVAKGFDVKENCNGGTVLLYAAHHGHIPIMHWLLTEGGSSLAERSTDGKSALLLAACNECFSAMQWLLEKQGASINESGDDGSSVWTYLPSDVDERGLMQTGHDNTAELSSLLKVMVMLQDAPVDIIAKLSPQHAEICTRGRLGHSCLTTWNSSGPRLSRTATCLLCYNPSSPHTPRPRRRTCGMTGCALKCPEPRGAGRR
jgi:hypothetical protein